MQLKNTPSKKWYLLLLLAMASATGFSQIIVVDGSNILASQQAKFPFWMAAGQTLAAGSNVAAVSVLEYSVVPGAGGDNDLRFISAKKITTVQTVPANRTWKVEAVLLDPAATSGLNGWTDDGTTVRLSTNTDNVGIGNSTPTQKLDVTGSVTASDFLNAGNGFRVANAAGSGTYLRGNGSNYVSSTIQVSDVPTLNQNTTGNAATATNVAYSGITAIPDRTTWSSTHRGFVAEQLGWKNYGGGHTIFDASAGTAPDGSSVNKTNSANAWTANYPTLMGWNGSSTYGVRVDAARIADVATSANGVAFSGITAIPVSSSWTSTHRGFVAEQLGWKNYGNSHTIFDASAGTAPNGSGISNTNPANNWGASYPTLMGWNGSSTYGVRVDVSRYAETAGALSGTVNLSQVNVDAGGGYMHLGAWTGTWSSGNSVLVQGSYYTWGANPSDRSLKKDIVAITDAQTRGYANDLFNTKLYTYQYIKDPVGSNITHLGMMADEAPAQMRVTGPGTVNINEGLMMSVAAIKVLKEENEQLQKRLEALEQEIQKLKRN